MLKFIKQTAAVKAVFEKKNFYKINFDKMKIFLYFLAAVFAVNNGLCLNPCAISGEKCTCTGVTLGEHEAFDTGIQFYITVKKVEFLKSKLSSIPVEIFSDFVNLNSLNIQKQQIKQIRQNTFERATNLKILDLAYNEISTLGKDSFRGAYHLVDLFLFNNTLQKIDQDTFTYLKNLKSLELQCNRLEVIPKRLFYSLVNLNELYMHKNQIQFLDRDLFKNNFVLTKLSLSNNKLKVFHYRMVSHLRYLTEFYIRGNECIHKDWNSNAYTHIYDIELNFKACNSNYDQYDRSDNAADVQSKAHSNVTILMRKIGSSLETVGHDFTNAMEALLKDLQSINAKVEKLESRFLSSNSTKDKDEIQSKQKI